MHSVTKASVVAAENSHARTWSEKLRREFRRVMLQTNTVAMRPAALMAGNRFLFILGHMRSGSTLLCHLLCNSDDVIGFGEAHCSYRRRSDLARLLARVYYHTGKNPLRYQYVLDKIVGSQHEISTAILSDPRTRYVFLIREPRASIASIVAMRRQFQDEASDELAAFATQYYGQRLKQLEQLAEAIRFPQRCLLLTHQQLLGETRTVFAALENLLELRAPLSENYALLPTTGQPGIGDPSPNIRRGRIDRSLPRKHVDLSRELWSQMEQCYASCLTKLQETMQTPSADIDSRCTSAA